MNKDNNDKPGDDMIKSMARAMWDSFSDNDKAAVRFGMMPAAPMASAMKLGFNVRDLSVAIMSVAKANGGMVA